MKYDIEVKWLDPTHLTETFTLEADEDDGAKFKLGRADEQTVLLQIVSEDDETDVRDEIYLRLPTIRAYRITNAEFARERAEATA